MSRRSPIGFRSAGGSRGVAPVVGVALLLVCTVVLGGAVALAAVERPADPPPTAAFALSADADADRIAVTHRGGDAVDVTDLRVRVEVEGEPLDRQPPVPFFAARGFRSGPTGPFNPSGGTVWRTGAEASLAVASTNAPGIDPGDEVSVRLSVRGKTVATLSATA
ncbi:type IV pilin N-terminal domain-containing protein [Halostella litorea]|uniref:type IV pilin N-terminal domain-containing protein n=1 Tax=Halostella litorea TaxID=2528831 RepID=UPI001F2FC556|nr:type IV pilin N-terminal domain-containing protein [Halostella litorea]